MAKAARVPRALRELGMDMSSKYLRGMPEQSSEQRAYARVRQPSTPLAAVPETTSHAPESHSPAHSPGGTNIEGAYSPFAGGDPAADASAAMRAAAAESAFEANVSSSINIDNRLADEEILLPCTGWTDVGSIPKKAGKRLPGGSRVVEVAVALGEGEEPTANLVSSIGSRYALRADSPDAPATHAEAVNAGAVPSVRK